MIEEAIALLGPVAQLKGIRLESTLAEGLDRPVHDPGFRRAVINLGLNAITAAESSVRISAAAKGNAITLAVEDDGPGVGETASGFGLSQVERASKAEGGTLIQSNVAPHGARFVIGLPSSIG